MSCRHLSCWWSILEKYASHTSLRKRMPRRATLKLYVNWQIASMRRGHSWGMSSIHMFVWGMYSNSLWLHLGMWRYLWIRIKETETKGQTRMKMKIAMMNLVSLKVKIISVRIWIQNFKQSNRKQQPGCLKRRWKNKSLKNGGWTLCVVMTWIKCV